jgi:hypothetical protein
MQMVCAFQHKALSEIPRPDLEAFRKLKRDRERNTSRVYREHVKEDLDGIERFLSQKAKDDA